MQTAALQSQHGGEGDSLSWIFTSADTNYNRLSFLKYLSDSQAVFSSHIGTEQIKQQKQIVKSRAFHRMLPACQ